MRGRVRKSGKQFRNGDKVYFKRPDRKEWSGPATVIGQEGKTIIIKYGAHIVKCHETHVLEIPYCFERDTVKDGVEAEENEERVCNEDAEEKEERA